MRVRTAASHQQGGGGPHRLGAEEHAEQDGGVARSGEEEAVRGFGENN